MTMWWRWRSTPRFRRSSGCCAATSFTEPGAAETPTVEAEEKRSLSFWSDDDGSWHLNATLPADEGAVIETALAAKRDELFRRDHPGVDPDSARGSGGAA